MLIAPDGLTDAHRRIFYRLIVVDAQLRSGDTPAQASAASRRTSLGS